MRVTVRSEWCPEMAGKVMLVTPRNGSAVLGEFKMPRRRSPDNDDDVYEALVSTACPRLACDGSAVAIPCAPNRFRVRWEDPSKGVLLINGVHICEVDVVPGEKWGS